MAFQQPKVQPFQQPREVGDNLVSRYLWNEYRVDFTPAWWRSAVDLAINYSDLTYLDTLYSWCMQSSPFLVSQVNKRLNPIKKASWAFAKNGVINQELTDRIVNTKWFNTLVTQIINAKFYGVRMVAIDPKTDEVVIYPIRNIDMYNKAIRYMTYEYYEVAYAKDYDNVFYIQPSNDQDTCLGMLQPISRAMIGIVEAYNDWKVTGTRYSYPMMQVGYVANDPDAKDLAKDIARNSNPMVVPVIEYTYEDNLSHQQKDPLYKVRVEPIQTQAYADAFRTYKEYIAEWESEIMQLVTGGTLLGATEKNTNSEQLANIHMDLYRDIIAGDKEDILRIFNDEDMIGKLARLLKDDELLDHELIEIPDKTLPIDNYVKIIKGMAQVGMRPKPEFFEKVGMDVADIDTDIRLQSWSDSKEREATEKTEDKSVKKALSAIWSKLSGKNKHIEEIDDGWSE